MVRLKTWFKTNAQLVLVVVLHTIAWALYLGFFMAAAWPDEHLMTDRIWYVSSVAFTDMSVFYYLYSNLIPRLLADKRGWSFTGLLLLVLALYPLARLALDHIVLYYHAAYSPPLLGQFSNQFWGLYGIRALSCLFVIIVAGLGKFTFDWFKNARIRRELETQNLSSELAFLKSQINPHFLFNTLNNIHTLAYKKADGTSEAIMKLSDLMRYMLYESNTDKVPLEKEVEHLKSFIGLQALRFKVKDIVRLEISGDTATKTIAPLLLLPFVENAFKHGYNLKKEGAILIKLHAGEQIEFLVENEKLPVGQSVQKDGVGGIGLENISRRLELIYGADYTLDIDSTSTHFKVNLSLRQNG